MIRSRDGRITANPLQEPEHDDDPGWDGPDRITTDPWGVTDIPGLNGEPAKTSEAEKEETE